MHLTRKTVALSVLLAVPVILSCRTAGGPAVVHAADACAAPDTNNKANQAQSMVDQKKYGEAEGPARDALAACPGHAQAAKALGAALIAQKKYDDAVSRLEGVVAANGSAAYAYYWLGHAYYNKKQNDKMARNFDKFLQLSPNAPEAASVRQLLAGIR
jgi:tetratricopeptide (TPR) repeat protein